MMTYDATSSFPTEEERELLVGSHDEKYYVYCEHTKSLIDIRSCKQSYMVFCMCCGPIGFIADIVTLVPKCIVNNAKMCLKW